MEQYLVHSIHSSLSLGLNDNARFLAERLVAAEPTEVSRFMSLSPANQVAVAVSCADSTLLRPCRPTSTSWLPAIATATKATVLCSC
jgi:hypothetical protein